MTEVRQVKFAFAKSVRRFEAYILRWSCLSHSEDCSQGLRWYQYSSMIVFASVKTGSLSGEQMPVWRATQIPFPYAPSAYQCRASCTFLNDGRFQLMHLGPRLASTSSFSLPRQYPFLATPLVSYISCHQSTLSCPSKFRFNLLLILSCRHPHGIVGIPSFKLSS